MKVVTTRSTIDIIPSDNRDCEILDDIYNAGILCFPMIGAATKTIKGFRIERAPKIKEGQKTSDNTASTPCIKSVTCCPTCGMECDIGGDDKEGTHYYIPRRA